LSGHQLDAARTDDSKRHPWHAETSVPGEPAINDTPGIQYQPRSRRHGYGGQPAFETLPRQWQDVAVPRTERVVRPVISRRRVLAGGAALATLGMAAAACSSQPTPPKVDELESQLKLARRDRELATAAATAAAQPVSAALTEVAAEREQHAQALATEIARLAVNPTSTSSETTSPTPTSLIAAPPPALADVVNSLRASAGSAGQLATTSSGYRAGLLGSIAAACTAAHTVALAFGESTP
jgi:hypothetical protein